ncbi:hypothetical protein JHK87_010278 [Glycine soja]|nr:hypothetical protein JHK87_010278 [Glycine soja]
MPHPTTAEGTQVMMVDEGSQIQALTVYQSSLNREFDIDPRDKTSDRDPKPIKELHYNSSVCHPWHVTHMQERIIAVTPVDVTHDE